MYSLCNNGPTIGIDQLGLVAWQLEHLSTSEAHTYWCDEWKLPGYSGKGDFQSYVQHFTVFYIDKPLFSKIPESARSKLASSIVYGIGITGGSSLWVVHFRYLTLAYQIICTNDHISGRASLKLTLTKLKELVGDEETDIFTAADSGEKTVSTPIVEW